MTSKRAVLTVSGVLLIGALTAVTGILWVGDALTKPSRGSIGTPPPDLAAQWIVLPSSTDVLLSAWFIQGEPRAGAVLLLHGVRASKRSMLARTRFLKALGFSVLVVDLQAHGDSTGERITFGHREAHDVDAAVRFLKQRVPGERIGILGTSLGAAAAVLSKSKSAYAAVVLESLYPTIEEAVENRLRLHLGPAGSWFAPLLLWQIEYRLGVRPEQLRPIEHVGEMTAPVLLVHGSKDRHTTLAEAQRLHAEIRAPKALFVIDGAAHVDLHAHATTAYEARVGAFFVSHLRVLPQTLPQVSRVE